MRHPVGGLDDRRAAAVHAVARPTPSDALTRRMRRMPCRPYAPVGASSMAGWPRGGSAAHRLGDPAATCIARAHAPEMGGSPEEADGRWREHPGMSYRPAPALFVSQFAAMAGFLAP